MLFWGLTVFLLLLAAAFVLVPMWRHQRSTDAGRRKAANLAIFRERLQELEAEFEGGAFDAEQFEALKAELERSLLSDIGEDEELPESVDPEQDRPVWRSPAALVPLLALVIIVPLSYLAYQGWGHQDDLQLAQILERSQQAEEPEEIRDVIFELGEIVERDRENGWAWYFLARNLTDLGQLEEAGMAFEQASQYLENERDRATVLGQYAQVAYMQADREITDEVQQIIDRARRLNPDETSVLQLLSTDAFLREDYQGAITYWQRMLNQTGSAQNRQALRSAIEQAQQFLEEGEGGNVADRQAQESESGPVIEVELSLADGIELASGTRVFVSAQAVNGGGPPLAVETLTVGDLPTSVTLSDADAVGPRALSSAQTVNIVATASRSGSADVQSGDYQIRSENIQLQGDSTRVSVQISDRVP